MNKQGTVQYDQHGFPLGSPISQGTVTKQVPWQFGINQGIQSKTARISQTDLRKVIVQSNQSTEVFTLGAGSAITWTSIDTFNVPKQANPMFTNPYTAYYLGSWPQAGIFKGSAQIWPTLGSGVAIGSYTTYGGFDWNSSDGTSSYMSVTLINNSGAMGTFTFVSQTMFFQYNRGTAS